MELGNCAKIGSSGTYEDDLFVAIMLCYYNDPWVSSSEDLCPHKAGGGQGRLLI